MKLTSSIAAIACATLCVFAFTANAEQPQQSTMQRYTFTYNFNKTVDPIVKRTQQTQQYVQYEVAVDMLKSAHSAINESYEEVRMIAKKDGLNGQSTNNTAITE